jgi:hypothetical protein
MTMAEEDLADDIVKVRETRGTLESVLVWIAESNNREAANIEKALELGAKRQQLQPFLEEIELTTAKAREVAQAILANPTGGTQPSGGPPSA